jgi:y4mF family transcriptional regulator
MLVKTVADIGQLVRQRRHRLGWDQRRLAKEAEVSRLWIIELEKGKPRASAELILRTLRVLGLSLLIEEAGADRPALDIDIDRIVDASRGKVT